MGEEETKPELVHDESTTESVFASLGSNKPRHVVFLDEFVGLIIQTFKLTELHIYTLDGKEPMIRLKGIDAYSMDRLEYTGSGKTIGHCLRSILDQVNERFPLGGIYGSPEA